MTRSRGVAGAGLLFGAFVVLGLPDFAHGVACPTGRLAARWGIEGLLLRSTLCSTAGLAVLALSPSWPGVLAGSFGLGIGADLPPPPIRVHRAA